MKSGKLSLRIPRSIHEQAWNAAERDGVSLNLWLAGAIAMAVARSDGGQAVIPKDRLEAIAADEFCEFPECSTPDAKTGVCVGFDAIYAACEALRLRERKCPDCGYAAGERGQTSCVPESKPI